MVIKDRKRNEKCSRSFLTTILFSVYVFLYHAAIFRSISMEVHESVDFSYYFVSNWRLFLCSQAALSFTFFKQRENKIRNHLIHPNNFKWSRKKETENYRSKKIVFYCFLFFLFYSLIISKDRLCTRGV